MSKKFLTLFALVALLVAAMAGAAFAADGDIEAITGAPLSHVGSMDYADGTGDNIVASGDLFYYPGTKAAGASIDIELLVGYDALADEWLMKSISADGDVTKISCSAIKSIEPSAAGEDTIKFEISLDAWPTFISIDSLGASSDAAVSADVRLYPKASVAVKLTEDGKALTADPIKLSDDKTFVVVSHDAGVSFDTLKLVAYDGDVIAALPTDLAFTITLDGDEIVVKSDDGSFGGDKNYKFALVANKLFVSEDQLGGTRADADGLVSIYGVNDKVALVSFTLQVGDPVEEGALRFKPEELTITIGETYNGVISVEPTAVDAAIESLSFRLESAKSLDLTVSPDKDKPKELFVISGTPQEEGKVTYKVIANLGADVEVSEDFVITVKKGGDGTLANNVTPVYLNETAQKELGVTTLTAADFELISDDITAHHGSTLLDAALPTNVSTLVGSSLVNIDLDEVETEGANAIALAFTAEDPLVTAIALMDGNDLYNQLTKSLDIYYEYVNVDDQGAATTDTVMHVIGNGAISWADAFDTHKVAKFDDDNNLVINYIIKNAEPKGFEVKGGFIIINDGKADTKLVDPLWVTEREASKVVDDGGSVGCDAGLGAFALLGLAGMAVILRKKD